MKKTRQPPVPLPAARDAAGIVAQLQQRTGKKIVLAVTDNATSMISFRRKGDIVFLRLHHLFCSAGQPILDEIAGFINNRRRSMNNTRAFINVNRHCLRPAAPRRVTLKTRGAHYDLRPIFDALNIRYFSSAVTAAITWGRRSARRFPLRRTLGTYLADRDIIRINPVLDSRHVPRFYLEYIMYHEMLHAVLNAEMKNGRRRVHSQEFRRREVLFEHYEQASQWEVKNR